MLATTALVLMMTIPGLALFYAGMVRKKNVLATLMQCFAITCIVTIVWMVAGYSLAFTNGNACLCRRPVALHAERHRGHIRTASTPAFILGAGTDGASPQTIPETVYMMFQMTFAIITPALIAGAFADRMKFSALCMFMALWSLLVYCADRALGVGADRLAGAHQRRSSTSPAAPWCTSTPASPALVCCLVLGKRVGYGTDNMAPYNLAYAVIGASLLWVGWFGFNAGSAVGANGRAGMAMAVTQIATAAAALAWMFAEWIAKGKPSVLGCDFRRGRGPGGDHAGLGLRAARRRRSSSASPPASICFWCVHQREAHVRLRRQPGRVRRARHRRHRRRVADRRVLLRPAVGDRRHSGRQSRRPARSS